MIAVKLICLICLILIFHTMIGYPVSLYFIDKFAKKRNTKLDMSLRPTVSVIIAAHNEEEVIYQKLSNLLDINYPKDLLEIIVSSDNSVDNTNQIVERFIEDNADYNIRLY